MKLQVEQIPHTLTDSVAKAEDTLKSILTKEFEVEKKLKHQEYESNIALFKQKIEHLEDRLAKQDQLIKELTDKADTASKQIQTIAYKALETSQPRNYRESANSSSAE